MAPKKEGEKWGRAAAPFLTLYGQNDRVTLSESTRVTRVDESKGNCSSKFTEMEIVTWFAVDRKQMPALARRSSISLNSVSVPVSANSELLLIL